MAIPAGCSLGQMTGPSRNIICLDWDQSQGKGKSVPKQLQHSLCPPTLQGGRGVQGQTQATLGTGGKQDKHLPGLPCLPLGQEQLPASKCTSGTLNLTISASHPGRHVTVQPPPGPSGGLCSARHLGLCMSHRTIQLGQVRGGQGEPSGPLPTRQRCQQSP